MKKLVVALCAAFVAVALAACGGGSSSSAASASGSASASASGSAASVSSASASAAGSLTDFGWVKFEMPEGYADAPESDAYVTIRQADNDRHVIKVFKKTLTSSAPTAAEYAAKEVAEHEGKYTDAGKVTVGDREWNLVGFTFNNNPSVYAYADAADKKCVYLTIYEMGIDDPAVQTVLSSLAVDESKL